MVEVIVESLKKYYGPNRVLENVSFKCEDEIVFIAGKNGVGKTTFIRIALGLDSPTEGKIVFLENTKKIRRDYVGAVLDTPALFPNLNGYQNIKILCSGYLKDKEYFSEILKGLELNDSILKKKTGKYSFGQKHRLSVAIAMIKKPKILFLDEPTIGLDPISWSLVKKTIYDNQRKFGGCVIVTGQDYFEMNSFANKILILNDGKCQVYEPIQDFMNRFSKQLIITTNCLVLPDEINQYCKYSEQNSLGTKYYFDANIKEEIIEAFTKHKISIENLLVEGISLKDAFLQTVNLKE